MRLVPSMGASVLLVSCSNLNIRPSGPGSGVRLWRVAGISEQARMSRPLEAAAEEEVVSIQRDVNSQDTADSAEIRTILPAPPTMSKAHAAEILRSRHQFECEQLHKRLSWLSAFESFLFAGLCLIWNVQDSTLLVFIIAMLGLAISGQGIAALHGVGIALINIRRDWIKKNLDEYDDLGIFGIFRGREVNEIAIFPWPEMVIPVACAVAWISVVIATFLRSPGLPL